MSTGFAIAIAGAAIATILAGMGSAWGVGKAGRSHHRPQAPSRHRLPYHPVGLLCGLLDRPEPLAPEAFGLRRAAVCRIEIIRRSLRCAGAILAEPTEEVVVVQELLDDVDHAYTSVISNGFPG